MANVTSGIDAEKNIKFAKENLEKLPILKRSIRAGAEGLSELANASGSVALVKESKVYLEQVEVFEKTLKETENLLDSLTNEAKIWAEATAE